MGHEARDKLLEKRVAGLNNVGCTAMDYSALILYGENGNSFLNLSSTSVGHLHFISVICALGIVLRHIFCRKQENSKSHLCNMIYIMSCYIF